LKRVFLPARAIVHVRYPLKRNFGRVPRDT
jgi:hypothetical protein